MAAIGNKQNAALNRGRGKHVRKRRGEKRLTAKRRRRRGKAACTNPDYL